MGGTVISSMGVLLHMETPRKMVAEIPTKITVQANTMTACDEMVGRTITSGPAASGITQTKRKIGNALTITIAQGVTYVHHQHPHHQPTAGRASCMPAVLLAPPAQATRTRPPARTNQRRASHNQRAVKARRSAPTPKLQNVLALSPHHGPRRLKAAWW